MKKFSTKIVSCIIIITIISSMFCVNAVAYINESGVTTYNQNCATYYYSSLITDFGNNSEGTCSYVAGAMLLSYYDNFLSDLFIEDNYETNGEVDITNNVVTIEKSPGIIREPRWTVDAYPTYSDYITEKADEYFHLELIRVARDIEHSYTQYEVGNFFDSLGFEKLVNEKIYPNVNWAISIPELAQVLEEYLQLIDLDDAVTVHCVSYKDYWYQNQETADSTIRDMVVEKVNQGIPVVYAGFYEDSIFSWSGHALIAYDYNPNTSSLVFHSGWNNSDRIIEENDVDFIYKEKLFALWLEIDSTKLSHNNDPSNVNYNCSNDYILTEGTAQTNVCMCSFDVHPKHNHDLPSSASGYSSSSHYYDCKWCDYRLTEAHSILYTNFSSTQHRERCTCGYTKLAAHIIRDSTATVKTCIKCGAIVESGGGAIVGMALGNIQYITSNGSYVRPDGIIVLSNTDYELYLAGELDIDSLESSQGCTH